MPADSSARGDPGAAGRLNAPTGARCLLTCYPVRPPCARDRLNAPTGARCLLTPGSGTGVMTPLPGPGAPPAPQAPRGTGQHQAQTTTFPCNHAKRHRQPQHPLQRTTSDDAMRQSRGRNRDLSPCMHQFARPWDHAPTTRIASRPSCDRPRPARRPGTRKQGRLHSTTAESHRAPDRHHRRQHL